MFYNFRASNTAFAIDAVFPLPLISPVLALGFASATVVASDIDLAISAPDITTEEWLSFTDALDELPIIYEFDVVRTERLDNPRLVEKIAREGISIYPGSTEA